MKPLKDRMRQKWVSHLYKQLTVRRDDSTSKFVGPTREDVVTWACDAWDTLSTSTIINGFRKAQLLPIDEAGTFDDGAFVDQGRGFVDGREGRGADDHRPEERGADDDHRCGTFDDGAFVDNGRGFVDGRLRRFFNHGRAGRGAFDDHGRGTFDDNDYGREGRGAIFDGQGMNDHGCGDFDDQERGADDHGREERGDVDDELEAADLEREAVLVAMVRMGLVDRTLDVPCGGDDVVDHTFAE